MNIIERFSGIFLIAGLFLFLGATLSLGIVPALMVEKLSKGEGLPTEVPPEFQQYYANVEDYHNGLRLGRDVYIAEACWHCHSQYVRPVSNESIYYGPVSQAGEYQNELHLPQLLGTRRVGPDLTREAGKNSNDWHFAHLYRPTNVVPDSVMPEYPWLFDKVGNEPPKANKKGIALVAYLQNLGAQVKDRKDTQWSIDGVTMPPEE